MHPLPPRENVVAPPPGGAPAEELDHDLVHINPGYPKIAGGFGLLAGLVAILNAVQTFLSVRIYGAWAVAPYGLIVLGAMLVYLSTKVFTARSWGAIAVVVVGAFLVPCSGAWLFFSLSHGLVALYALWTPLAASVAVVLAATALPACDRATRSRKRLADLGMSFGL